MLKTTCLLIVLFACILSSCSPQFYEPPPCNVPLLRAKGEALLGAGFGAGDLTTGFNAQLAYAVDNHWGLMSDLSANKAYQLSNDNVRAGRQTTINLGAGYFTTMGKNGIFDVWAGFGKGWVNNVGTYNYVDESTGNSIGTFYNLYNPYNRIFIQTSAGGRVKNIEIAVTVRAAYNNQERIGDPRIIRAFSDVVIMNAYHNYFLFEPALTLRYGFENFKLQGQICFSNNLTYNDFPQGKYIAQLGLCYRVCRH